MAKHQHLTLIDRRIASMLKEGASFCSIAQASGKSVSCISSEVKKRRVAKESGYFGHRFNNCLHRKPCPEYGLCDSRHCSKLNCSNCPNDCGTSCPSFEEEQCELLEKAPYVCNGRSCRQSCSLRKMVYNATLAQKHYEKTLSEARQGSQLLFRVVADSYEQKSLIVTTNLEFSKWRAIFTDEQMAAAMIDRMIHHGHLMLFEGKSYRLTHALMRQAIPDGLEEPDDVN